uniref:Uncharacterized protein n=1 Tax=Branchiostoma floridae TaxID=7739 RepID=C3ZLF4_BRAFL|eukprot:XP_002590580.1 hypothetical protein BRAFLDRAFT_123623 [Branchiostoma floridae]
MGRQFGSLWPFFALSAISIQIVGVVHADIPEVSANALRDSLEGPFGVIRHHLANPSGKAAARTHIIDVFQEYGLDVTVQNFTGPGGNRDESGTNIIGVKRGKLNGTSDDKIVAVGAHYDTASNSPGVNDDGSGMAALLEIIRVMTSCSQQNYTTIFVAFDKSEAPGVSPVDVSVSPCQTKLGSDDFVCSWLLPFIQSSGGPEFQGIFMLETIMNYDPRSYVQYFPERFQVMYPNAYLDSTASNMTGDFLMLIHKPDEAPLVTALQQTWDGTSKEPAGARLLDVTVQAEANYRGTMRQCYHNPCDNVTSITDEKLTFLAKVTDSVLQTTLRLAQVNMDSCTADRCEDHHDQCSEWAAQGECGRNQGYMLAACRKSCDTCAQEFCADYYHRCEDWAADGECDSNPRYMMVSCRLSCNACEAPTSPTGCKDDNALCPAWAADGECETNPTWMLDSCQLSCGSCAVECKPGFKGFRGKCEASRVYKLSIRLKSRPFSDDLKKNQSTEYVALAAEVTDTVQDLFRISNISEVFQGATILGFRAGSVIADLKVHILQSAEEGQDEVIAAFSEALEYKNGTELDIDLNLFDVTDLDECSAPELNDCSEKASCTNTVGSFSCQCRGGYEDQSAAGGDSPGRVCVVPTGKSKAVWIAVACGVLLACIVVGVVVYKRKQQKSAEREAIIQGDKEAIIQEPFDETHPSPARSTPIQLGRMS